MAPGDSPGGSSCGCRAAAVRLLGGPRRLLGGSSVAPRPRGQPASEAPAWPRMPSGPVGGYQLCRVPVVASPSKTLDGGAYHSSVSIRSLEESERLLSQIQSQEAPLALVVLGPRHPAFVGVGMTVPVLKRGPKATKAAPSHVDATVCQFGR